MAETTGILLILAIGVFIGAISWHVLVTLPIVENRDETISRLRRKNSELVEMFDRYNRRY